MLAPLVPFLILLVIALIFQIIPMNPTIKQVGYIIIAIAAIILLLKFLGLL